MLDRCRGGTLGRQDLTAEYCAIIGILSGSCGGRSVEKRSAAVLVQERVPTDKYAF